MQIQFVVENKVNFFSGINADTLPLLTAAWRSTRTLLLMVGCMVLMIACTAVEREPYRSAVVEEVIDTPTPPSKVTPLIEHSPLVTEMAQVEKISISTTDQGNPSVVVDAQGLFSDDCSYISHSHQFWENGNIYLEIYATKNNGLTCIETDQLWEDQFEIDIHGIAAETYTIFVNDIAAELTVPSQ